MQVVLNKPIGVNNTIGDGRVILSNVNLSEANSEGFKLLIPKSNKLNDYMESLDDNSIYFRLEEEDKYSILILIEWSDITLQVFN